MSSFRGAFQSISTNKSSDDVPVSVSGQSMKDRSWKERIPKVVRSNWVTWLAAIVAFLNALAISIWYAMSENMRAADFPLVNLIWEYKTVDVDGDHHNFATPSMDHSANWYGGVGVMVLAWLALIPPLAELLARGTGFFKYQVGRNIYRWLPDSLVTPLMAVSLIVFLSDVNTFGVFSTFVLVHIVTIGGLSLEAMNAPESLQLSEVATRPEDEESYEDVKTVRTSVTFYPLMFAVWISLLSFVIPVTLLATTFSLSYVSAYEWVGIALYVVFGMMNSLIQIQYYRTLYMPTMSVWPFKKTRDGSYFSVDNYERYQSLLTGSAMFWRTLIILFLAVTASMPNYYYFPHMVQSSSLYAACRPFIDPQQDAAAPDTKSATYLIRQICAEASSELSVLSMAGYTGVENINPGDKPHNRALSAVVDEDKTVGAAAIGGGASLKANFLTSCVGSNSIIEMFPQYCLAYNLAGLAVPGTAENFDRAACCTAMRGLDNSNRPNVVPIYSSCTCTVLVSKSTNTYNPRVWANDKLGKGKDVYNKMTVVTSDDDDTTTINYLGEVVVFGKITTPSTEIDLVPYDKEGDEMPEGSTHTRRLSGSSKNHTTKYLKHGQSALSLDIKKSGFTKDGIHKKW